MRDYLGDLIIRIKNAQKSRLPELLMHPYLPLEYIKILRILYLEGYIRGFENRWDAQKGRFVVKVFLKYNTRGEPIIENVFRVSTPGRRIYVSTKTLWQPKSNRGLFVLSTPKGFLVDRDARLLNVGGELLFGIY